MKILYFTATGNSLHVAKSLGGELLSIPQMIKEGRYDFTDDKIGIVFPIYEWSVNSYVVNFLEKAVFHTDYLFAIGTYGIFACGFGSHLRSIADAHGHNFAYINKVKMVDNYLPGFSMKAQIKNEHKKDIEGQISIVKSDVDAGKRWCVAESFMLRRMTQFMVNREAKKPRIDKGINRVVRLHNSCIHCGVCTQVCPANNITLDSKSGQISFGNRCFSCYACLQNCPSNTIHIKTERDASRFRNSHVTLQEIIEANK